MVGNIGIRHRRQWTVAGISQWQRSRIRRWNIGPCGLWRRVRRHNIRPWRGLWRRRLGRLLRTNIGDVSQTLILLRMVALAGSNAFAQGWFRLFLNRGKQRLRCRSMVRISCMHIFFRRSPARCPLKLCSSPVIFAASNTRRGALKRRADNRLTCILQ